MGALHARQLKRERFERELTAQLTDRYGHLLEPGSPLLTYFRWLYLARFPEDAPRNFHSRGVTYYGRKFRWYSRECIGIWDSPNGQLRVLIRLTQGHCRGRWILTWAHQRLFITLDGKDYELPAGISASSFIDRLAHAAGGDSPR
jgi:hypothetical protein